MEPLVRVAFVCPRMTNAFSRTIWYSLQESAKALGVHLTAVLGGPIDHPRLPIPARRVYDLLDPTNFDGVLLHTASLSYHSDRASLNAFLGELGNLPVVSLGVALEGLPSVAIDQAKAIDDLVVHLHEHHGYRRFAFVTGPLEQIEARLRRDACLAALKRLGVPDERVEVFTGDYSRDSGAAAVRALTHQDRWPIALVCSNDEAALGAIDEAKALGVAVPTQLAVTGFDDVDLAALHEPSLTSVSQPFIRHAGQALTRLVALIRGRPVDNAAGKSSVEPARLIFRESCGCRPPTLEAPQDKSGVLRMVVDTQDNATDGFREFIRDWATDYLTAFEYLVDTGNASVLKSQWARYYARVAVEQERGVSFRRLFFGLEVLYGKRPGFAKALQENLLLAGAAESRKGTRDNLATRNFFFVLHNLETTIGQINDRDGLMALPVQQLSSLGIVGLALVRFGAPPTLVYLHTKWTPDRTVESWGPIGYPALLPEGLETTPSPAHRLVVALTGENSYLGYAVFWTEGHETFVCDFLANQFSGALQRLELLERIREQSQSLKESLEETQRMQKQLVETEKVASLGRLVAGVAHEINTPLGTGITGTSFLVERLAEVRAQFGASTLARSGLEQFFQQGQEALDGVLRNLMKAGELIQAFKGLGLDHGQGEWRPVHLHALFGDLGSVYQAELAQRGIVLRCELPEEGVMVYSQPSALVQVAGELLENAMVHAFPSTFTGSPLVIFQVERIDDVLRLAVTDNGRGLTPDERRHIFDPLYTTRRPEGHAGLGLHLAFQLITRTLEGQMTVASEPGAGSCFLCLIPLKR